MWINTETMLALTDVSYSFKLLTSKVAEYGSVVILKNNQPLYVAYSADVAQTKEKQNVLPIREASQNFSLIKEKIYNSGYVVITKRNKPEMIIWDFNVVSSFSDTQVIRKENDDA